MNLIFDLDKEILVTKAGASAKLTRADTKKGDVRAITVMFVRSSATPVIPEGAITEMIFVAKRSTGLTAVALLLTNNWTFNATLSRWEGVITEDHARLVDIMASGANTNLLAEFSFTTAEIGPITSQIFTISLENDLWKGTEGTPLSLPSPAEWLATQSAPTTLTPAGAPSLTAPVGTFTAGSKRLYHITSTTGGVLALTDIVAPDGYTLPTFEAGKLYVVMITYAAGGFWILTTIVGPYTAP